MNGILMEEPETQPESKRRGIRIEKPESNPSPPEPSRYGPESRTPVIFAAKRRLNFFFRFLIFLTYLFSAAALYLAFRAAR